MVPIPIETTFEESYRQILFIDNFIVTSVAKKNIKRAIVFLTLSIVVILLFFLTDSDSIVAWFVLIPLFWVCFGLYLIYIKWKTYRRQKFTLRQFVVGALQENPSVLLCFSESEIQLLQKDRTTIAKWDEFKAFLEDQETVYLFNENPYLAWSFSTKEIGRSAIDGIKEIIRQKSIPLLTIP